MRRITTMFCCAALCLYGFVVGTNDNSMTITAAEPFSPPPKFIPTFVPEHVCPESRTDTVFIDTISTKPVKVKTRKVTVTKEVHDTIKVPVITEIHLYHHHGCMPDSLPLEPLPETKAVVIPIE